MITAKDLKTFADKRKIELAQARITKVEGLEKALITSADAGRTWVSFIMLNDNSDSPTSIANDLKLLGFNVRLLDRSFEIDWSKPN